MDFKRRMANREDSAAPALLPTMLVSTLAVVAAVAVVGRTDSPWADVGALALLLGALANLLGAILRRLHDDPGSGDRTMSTGDRR
jgi:hypothetical protein